MNLRPAAACLLPAAAVSAEEPKRLLVSAEPPAEISRGEPLRIVAETSGSVFAARVLLHWAGDEATPYATVVMRPVGPRRWAAEVPAAGTEAREIRYYIEAWDKTGSIPGLLGTADRPLRVHPRPRPALGALVAGAVVVALSAALVALGLLRQARRRRLAVDRLFWAVTLRPLAALPPAEQEARLAELGRKVLAHPLDGARRYAPGFLRRRLRALAPLPPERVVPDDLLAVRAMRDALLGERT